MKKKCGLRFCKNWGTVIIFVLEITKTSHFFRSRDLLEGKSAGNPAAALPSEAPRRIRAKGLRWAALLQRLEHLRSPANHAQAPRADLPFGR